MELERKVVCLRRWASLRSRDRTVAKPCQNSRWSYLGLALSESILPKLLNIRKCEELKEALKHFRGNEHRDVWPS